MILLLLGIISLSAIYFTHLLSEKGMKTASGAIAALYAVIVAWTYFIFIFDATSLGFNGSETWRSMLIGSDVYRSFVDLNEIMSELPDSVLRAITYISFIVLGSALLVVLHGTYSAAAAVIGFTKKALIRVKRTLILNVPLHENLNLKYPFIRLHCRMNC